MEKVEKAFEVLKRRKILALGVAAVLIFSCLVAVVTIPPFFRYKIAIIEVRGELGEDFEAWQLRSMLMEAESSPSIKAVVLDIDSAGGLASESYEMYAALKEFDKPCVSYSSNAMTSGAYLLALGSDSRVAQPFARIGAVGVVIVFPFPIPIVPEEPQYLWSITSGRYKDLFATDVLTWEAREYLQNRVNQMADVFLKIVANETGLNYTTLKADPEISEAAWFNGVEALEKDLIDHVGTMRDGLQIAAEKANLSLEQVTIVKLTPPEEPPKTFPQLSSSDDQPFAMEGIKVYLMEPLLTAGVP